MTATTPTPVSSWSALRRPLFRNLWLAAIVSNVGSWMQDTAGAWLMTALTTSPLLIALMQTAAVCCSSGNRGCWPASPFSPP